MKKQKTVPVSEFKAKALDLFSQVAKQRESIIVTKHGQHIATVIPANMMAGEENVPGRLAGTVEIVGDVLEPLGDKFWTAAK